MIDKEKSLAYRFPELAKEWHPTKNGDLTPFDITCGSGKKVWWFGECGHEWDDTVSHRTEGRACPYCSNHRILLGCNNLFATNPELETQWDFEKNESIDPSKITNGSHKNVWWKCTKGHSFQRTIREQVKGIECPNCSNKKLLPGFNDITITHPQLLKFWDYEKNDKDPHNVLFNGTDKYWWKFECGHERYATCKAVEKFPQCIYCYGQNVLSGYNDFATKQPELLEEWDYSKNTLDPTQIGEFSNKYAYWICKKCNHKWKAIISSRSSGRGCPQCNLEKNTSFGEQAIYYYINKLNINVINRFKVDGKYEIDVFLPDKNIGIEYDGFFFHKDKEASDKKKEQEICNRDILLFRVVESKDKIPTPYWENNRLIYQYDKNGVNLSIAIKFLFSKIGITFNDNFVDVERDYSEINKSYQKVLKQFSLEKISEEVLKDWDYEKNFPITPDKVYSSSGKRVWWKCSVCGEEYFRSPNEVRAGCKCPKCSHIKRVHSLEDVLLKKNGSMIEKNPDFLKEWNYEKNTITPDQITIRSNKKIWWKCSVCGFEWQATPANRSQGKGCHQCAKKLIGAKKSKEVHQYTINGEYITSFKSVTEATNQTGIKHISSVCLGTRKSAGGYLWSYEKHI